jgi:hypothetical protein
MDDSRSGAITRCRVRHGTAQPDGRHGDVATCVDVRWSSVHGKPRSSLLALVRSTEDTGDASGSWVSAARRFRLAGAAADWHAGNSEDVYPGPATMGSRRASLVPRILRSVHGHGWLETSRPMSDRMAGRLCSYCIAWTPTPHDDGDDDAWHEQPNRARHLCAMQHRVQTAERMDASERGDILLNFAETWGTPPLPEVD